MTTETILLLNGRLTRRPVCFDSHTGEPYVYAANANNITVRVYIEPGASVPWVERKPTDGYGSATEVTRRPVTIIALAA